MRMRWTVSVAGALAAAGLAAWLLAGHRGSPPEPGAGTFPSRAKTAPPSGGLAAAAQEAHRRPALRGTYRRGEGGHVRIEIEHGLPPRPPGAVPAGIARAERWGARGRVTLRVADPAGRPVAGAYAAGAFYRSDSNGLGWDVQGETDRNGEIAMENRACLGYLVFEILKPGYYKTALRYDFLKAGFDCVRDGRWQPWDPVLGVVLKEKRKPIPMYVRRINSGMPTRSVPVGFDFKAGDWVAPYGKGVSSDMLLTYSEAPETNTWERYDFSISFTNRCDGAYVRRKDGFSAFASDYEAPDNGYRGELSYVYERTDTKIIQEKRLAQDEVMVFRVRSKIDEKGNVVEANYGKIYGEFDFAHGPKKLVIFSYYLNPTPNDRNLEFDGKTNLFRPGPHDYDWPREP